MGDDPGGSFTALYRFGAFGQLSNAKIFKSLPTKAEGDALVASLLEELAGYTFGDIKVAPFAVETFGRQFGLIFDPSDDEDDDSDNDRVWVTAEPGNYMAFYPPWDGEYDT